MFARIRSILVAPYRAVLAAGRHGPLGVARQLVRRGRHRLALPILQRIDRVEAALAQWQAASRNHWLEQSTAAAETAALLRRQEALLQHQEALLQHHAAMLARHGRSIEWLATAAAESPAARPTFRFEDGPRISVVMATWNRGALIGRAIESVIAQTYPRWELLIVDDGSTDDTAAVVRTFASDPRIRFFSLPHRGTSAARNFALERAGGEVVAYLDSDNGWYPHYLEAVAAAYLDAPEVGSAHAAILFHDHAAPSTWIEGGKFEWEDLLARRATIDLNAFSHRLQLVQDFGGFDEGLRRLIDLDLVLRYTKARPPRRLAVVAGVNELGDWPRISNQESFCRHLFLVRAKHLARIEEELRVLYVLRHYPQLSESYVATEIAFMRRRGVHVEVWSETSSPSPFETDVPIHRGSLAAAIAISRPDLIHLHWLHIFDLYRSTLAAAALPVTIRSHGFEYSAGLVDRLLADEMIRAVYVFPHQYAELGKNSSKLVAVPSAFDPTRYHPDDAKDRRLVVRVAAGLPTKELPFFLDVAALCPEFHFVLAMVRCEGLEHVVDEVAEENRRRGEPAELHVNLQPERVSALVRRAGIYLHTHPAEPPFGMPISIAESMASGCYVLTRRIDPFADYVNGAGDHYRNLDEAAALVRATLNWDEEQWRRVELRAVDQAFHRFVDAVALEPILEDWRRIRGERSPAAEARKRAG